MLRPHLTDGTGPSRVTEAGIKGLGWQWQRSRRTDPARVARHWLVLAVASLTALAHGTRVEDAHERGLPPARLRTPPASRAGTRPRRISLVRLGIPWLG